MIGSMNRLATFALVGLALIAAASCMRSGENSVQGSKNAPNPPIAEVLARHTPTLMAIPGVVGTYQGALSDGTPVIKVLVLDDHPEAAAKIAKVLEGYRVEVEKTDEIRPMGGDSTGG
jgi:hypothetical protein